MLFSRKFQLLAQIVGTLCLFGLLGYGLLTILPQGAIAWAMPDSVASTDSAAAPAQQTSLSVPQQMNYQDELRDNNGTPLNGTHNITVRIYDRASGGTALWSEQHTNVTVQDGLFNVLLGSVTAMPATLFQGSTRFVGVTVAPQGEMTPRQPLASVPYALRAHEVESTDTVGTADTLDGLDSSAFSRTGHIHDDRHYSKDALATSGLAQIDWGNLTNVPDGFADGTDDGGLGGDITLNQRYSVTSSTAQCINSCPSTACTVHRNEIQMCVGDSCSGWQTSSCTFIPRN